MRSTFMGLETNKRGLYTQQTALYTTGHNISNANTLGYTRQRVNMESTTGFPGVGLNSGTMPGFLGTGVQSGSIQRIRDSFVDKQFRQESNKFGYWESQSKAISQMEDVLTEPSTTGLQKAFSEFWQSLQDVATNPSEAGARAVAIRKGQAVADSFNYMHKSLTQIQTNLGTEIGQSTKEINSILKQLAEVNEQIKSVEPNGYIPNDLYDQRDLLLDELSMYVPIEVEYTSSGGRSIEGVSEGWATVKMKLADGSTATLVEGNKYEKISVDFAPGDGNQPVTGIEVTGHGPITFENLSDVGKLKSLMNSYGVDDGTDGGKGLYPDMIAELNKMAKEFADAFNEIHEGGFGLPPDNASGISFFEGSTAGDLKINQALLDDPSKFAASSANGEEGNSEKALELAGLEFKAIVGLDNATIETYFQGVIGDLGVNGLEANKMVKNTVTLLGAVEQRRASISSVSLDEEMTDMIRFQQAYNASARMVTVVDETLDKIINGMGVVGR